ncbi:MAG: hypothetical protein OEY28_04985, partial [Nitrospira sp.]|nr:hypothetical protein [Nitrospira sp.]
SADSAADNPGIAMRLPVKRMDWSINAAPLGLRLLIGSNRTDLINGLPSLLPTLPGRQLYNHTLSTIRLISLEVLTSQFLKRYMLVGLPENVKTQYRFIALTA